jgi:CVNH domain
MNGPQVPMAIRLQLRGSSPALSRPDHFRCPQCGHVGVGLQISFVAFAALLIIGSMFLQPAHAQAVPPGSYRASCTDIRVEDRTLTAVCRIADGTEQRTTLTDVNRCVGDIGNDNGALTCGHGQPMAPYREDRR